MVTLTIGIPSSVWEIIFGFDAGFFLLLRAGCFLAGDGLLSGSGVRLFDLDLEEVRGMLYGQMEITDRKEM